MLGISKAEHVSSELQDHVLKTTAGPQARYEILASQADGLTDLGEKAKKGQKIIAHKRGWTKPLRGMQQV